MLPHQNENLTVQSLRYLSLCVALDTPPEPATPEQARNTEIARLLAFDPNSLPAAFALSEALLFERDFAAGCQPGVAFDVDSLTQHFQTDRQTMMGAIKLCGAMPFESNGKTVWADDERVRLTLDAAAIGRATAKAQGAD